MTLAWRVHLYLLGEVLRPALASLLFLFQLLFALQLLRGTDVLFGSGVEPLDILRMILGQSSRLVLYGLASGLVLTFALGRLLSNLLFGVSAFDPVVLTLVCGLLLSVAIAATIVPAWRAARIDPLRALRQD